MVHHRLKKMFYQLQKGVMVIMASGTMLLGTTLQAQTTERPPLRVVASFSILADMVREIGSRHVDVVAIVGPNADSHAFEPTPQAVQTLAQADVLVANGLNFEAWLPRLIESSGFSGAHIVASDGVTPRVLGRGGDITRHRHVDAEHSHQHQTRGHHHQHGGIDPHAWQNLQNGMIYARNIAEGLAKADPARASNYQRRVKKYLATMEKLDTEVRAALNAIPEEDRKAITAHDAFGYFGDAYGVEFIPIAGFSDQAEPSAKDIAALIDKVRQESRVGIFTEKTSSPKLLEQLGKETDASVGGPLYSDALDHVDQPASTYLGMFHWNAGQLISVLKPATPSGSD